MALPLVILASAASFACVNPTHHDGDNLRCSNMGVAMRLQGIDAPEMPGACRPGRDCTPGDPYEARDYLRGLTAGKTLQCVQEDTDSYDRPIVNCTAGDTNISCAMIASGRAVARYAPLDCGGSGGGNGGGGGWPAEVQTATAAPVELPAPPRAQEPPPVIVPADLPARTAARESGFGWTPVWISALALINAITWALFAIDKRRAQAGRFHDRIAESTLLGCAAVGGSPAAWHAMSRLRHKCSKDSFKLRLLLISGVQAGVMLGGILWLWP